MNPEDNTLKKLFTDAALWIGAITALLYLLGIRWYAYYMSVFNQGGTEIIPSASHLYRGFGVICTFGEGFPGGTTLVRVLGWIVLGIVFASAGDSRTAAQNTPRKKHVLYFLARVGIAMGGMLLFVVLLRHAKSDGLKTGSAHWKESDIKPVTVKLKEPESSGFCDGEITGYYVAILDDTYIIRITENSISKAVIFHRDDVAWTKFHSPIWRNVPEGSNASFELAKEPK